MKMRSNRRYRILVMFDYESSEEQGEARYVLAVERKRMTPSLLENMEKYIEKQFNYDKVFIQNYQYM